jgi:hypothetical protein
LVKYFLIILLIATAFPCYAGEPYLRKSTEWTSNVLHKKVPVKIYFLQDSTTDPDGAEVIVYLKNKAWERIGNEPDASILTDYIQKKFIVITIDYGNEPTATSPHFDDDLDKMMKAVYGFHTESLLEGTKLRPKEFRCFFLPAGYRVATDLSYWEIDKHAAFGTMEFIMQSYNEDIVSKYPGMKKVSSPHEMVDRKGRPFDYKIKMDIVYPSHAAKRLPVIFFSDYFASRTPNSSPNNYLPHFAGFTTRGYVYVDIGHCFNPCVTHFFHFSKFTLDHENGYACYTAAIRYLRANASKYSMDTAHIGGAGISKGQYFITRISDPHHEQRKEEVRKFEGQPDGSPEPQPWQGHSSKINAGMQGMGMGSFETEFLTADYEPNLIICGEYDRDVITKQHHVFVKKLEDLNANYLGLFMDELGHEFPHGFDKEMNVDRYQLVHDFFDRYLKTEDHLAPVVLVVSASPKVSVQFAPVIDEKTITENNGIRIIRTKTKEEIKGVWKASHGGTKFTFSPAHPLNRNEQYEIVVSRMVRDKNGTQFGREKIVTFKVEE